MSISVSEINKALDSDQLWAVKHLNGYARVFAGAGSGKTRVLTYRFAYLCTEFGFEPSSICCVTFTVNAAKEMKKRIRKMIDVEPSTVYTFNKLGYEILKKEIHRINWPDKPPVKDVEAQEAILKDIYVAHGITRADLPFRDARWYINRQKNERKYLKYLDMHSPYRMDRLIEDAKAKADYKEMVWYAYLRKQRDLRFVDFMDQQCVPLMLFSEYPDMEQEWQSRFNFLMVDEFQDVSDLNYDLCEILSGKYKNVFVVGDPDQTIYEWRGANMKYFLEYERDHPNTTTYRLAKNYRSTRQIVRAANSIIEHNQYRKDFNMVAVDQGKSARIWFYHAPTLEKEAKFVIDRIKDLQETKKARLKDIAVLYRMHTSSKEFERAFRAAGIQFRLFGSILFMDRKEIRSTVAYLKLLTGDDDDALEAAANYPIRGIDATVLGELRYYAAGERISLFQAMKRKIADGTFRRMHAGREFVQIIEHAREMYAAGAPLPDILMSILEESGIRSEVDDYSDESRPDAIVSLVNQLDEAYRDSNRQLSLDEFMGILQTNAADDEKADEYVRMMTVHQAKGLEFPYVFLVDMEEGVFPSSRIKTDAQFEEERRLAYVAFTRAEKQLFLSDHEAVSDSSAPAAMFSRYILEAGIDQMHLVRAIPASMRQAADEAYRIADATRRASMPIPGAEEIKIGDRLYHRTFGAGVVVNKTDRGVIQFKPDNEEWDYRFSDLSVFTTVNPDDNRMIDESDDNGINFGSTDDDEGFDREADD